MMRHRSKRFQRVTISRGESTRHERDKGTDLSVVGVALTFIGAILGASLDYAWHNREIDAKMVGFAIDVLKSDCRSTPGLVPARKWAVDLLSHYAKDVPIDSDARTALTQNSVRPGEVLVTEKGQALATENGTLLLARLPESGCSAPEQPRQP